MITSDALRNAAESLQGSGRELTSSSDRHDAVRLDLSGSVDRIPDAWTSDLATVAVQRAQGVVGLVQPVSPALGSAAAAITSLATEAQTLAAELLRHERSESDATNDLAHAQWQRAVTDPTDVETLRMIAIRERSAIDRQRAARARIVACEQEWDAACRRTAVELRSAAVPIRIVSMQGPLWTPLDGRAAAGGGFWPQLRDFLFGDILTFWSGGDGRPPIGGGLAAMIRLVRTTGWGIKGGAPDGFPTFANGGLGKLLSKLPKMGWITSPATQAVLTRLGVVGGLVTGGSGAWALYQHGNPITAFQTEGAGYTADVGKTVFGFGTAGLATLAVVGVAAPPVLIAVTVGAGVVWLGSEVIDNWDAIVDWTSNAWDATTAFVGDAWDGATTVASIAWDGATNIAGNAWDGATNIAGNAWDGATNLAGGVADSVTGTLSDAPLIGGLFSS